MISGGTVRAFRLLVVLSATLASLLAPVTAANASVDAVTSVSPSRIDSPTNLTLLDIAGTGLAAGDVVSESPSSSAILFSTSVDDGAGGIKVNVRVTSPVTGIYDIVVTDPSDGSSATCAGCLQVGAPPAPVHLVTVTPGDGSLALAWSLPAYAGTSAVLGYHVTWDDPTGPVGGVDVTDAHVVVTGLTNSIDYTFRVAPYNSWGAAAPAVLHEEVGTVPDRPAITGFTPYPFAARLQVQLGNTWMLPRVAYDTRWTSPDGTTGEIDGDSVPELLNVFDRGTYAVQVRAVNSVGPSAWSDSFGVHVITEPGPARHLRATHFGLPVRLSWDAPRTDGGSPITGYTVRLASDLRDVVRTFHTTGRSLLLTNLHVGDRWRWEVSALNAATAARSWTAETAEASLVQQFDTATTATVGTGPTGRARWIAPGGSRWSGLGRRTFVTAPTPLRARGRTYFVGSTARGVLLIRSLSAGWHRLAAPLCFDAGAQVGRHARLWVACRDSAGRLAELSTWLPKAGLPTAMSYRSTFAPRIVGAPRVGRGGYGDVYVAFRTPGLDGRRHNVRLAQVDIDYAQHVPLTCGSPLAFATTQMATTVDAYHLAALACRQDRTHVAWATVGYPNNSTTHGVLTLPFSPSRELAVVYPGARLQLILRTTSGVRRYDPRTRTWRSFGWQDARSLEAVTWTL